MFICSGGFNLDIALGNELAQRGRLKPGSAESKRCILFSRAPRARQTDDGLEILPWQTFLKQLWNDELPP